MKLHLVAGAVDLFLFSAALVFCAVFLLRKLKPDDFGSPGWLGKSLRVFTLVLGLVPGYALGQLAITMIQDQTVFGFTRVALSRFAFVSMACSMLGVLFAASYVYRSHSFVARFFKVTILTSVVAWLVGCLMFSIDPYGWGSMWGPLATLFSGLAFWLVIITFLVWRGKVHRIPYLAIYFAMIFLVQGLNLQHIRSLEVTRSGARALDRNFLQYTDNEPPTQPSIASDFEEWLESRPDYRPHAKEPFPVILVAAEGGGIRAATLTSLTLARLDEVCATAGLPFETRFSDHVFCMSGVSGGSVGIGFYRAMLHLEKENNLKVSAREREQRLRQLLGEDYLSAPLGRLFFTDGAFSCIPFLSYRWIDRSAALSASFRQAWSEHARQWSGKDTDTLDLPLANFAITDGPNLLFNATSVTQHSPFAITRLSLDDSKYSLNSFGPNCDLHLGDAMCLSSRFPGISTEGVIDCPTGAKNIHNVDAFVDAGYFDNSGLDSLNRVLDGVADATTKWNLNIRILIVRIGSQLEGPDTKEVTDEMLHHSLPSGLDVLAPIYAASHVYLSSVLNSDRKLFDGVDAMRFRTHWHSLFGNHASPSYSSASYAPIVLHHVNERDPKDQLPLGWIISKRSIDNISEEIGELHGDDAPPLPPSERAPRVQNAYVLWSVKHWLNFAPKALHGGLLDTGHGPTHPVRWDRPSDPPQVDDHTASGSQADDKVVPDPNQSQPVKGSQSLAGHSTSSQQTSRNIRVRIVDPSTRVDHEQSKSSKRSEANGDRPSHPSSRRNASLRRSGLKPGKAQYRRPNNKKDLPIREAGGGSELKRPATHRRNLHQSGRRRYAIDPHSRRPNRAPVANTVAPDGQAARCIGSLP